MDNEIQKTEHHKLVAGGGEGLTSFFIPGDIDAAFRENEYAVTEMVSVLCEIMRGTEMRIIHKKDGTIIEEPVCSPRDRMAAIKLLDEKAMRGMVLGGLIQNDRLEVKTTLADGSVAEYSQEGMKLVEEGSDRLKSTLALLEKASESKSDEIIDVEVINESGNGRCDEARDSVVSNSNRGGDDGSLSGGSISTGDGTKPAVHGEKRGASSKLQSTEISHDNKGTVKGTTNERGSGIPVQSKRDGKSKSNGSQSGGDGEGDRGNLGPPKQPVRIGGNALVRTDGSNIVTPRRETGNGDDPALLTAAAIADRLDRIKRATGDA